MNFCDNNPIFSHFEASVSPCFERLTCFLVSVLAGGGSGGGGQGGLPHLVRVQPRGESQGPQPASWPDRCQPGGVGPGWVQRPRWGETLWTLMTEQDLQQFIYLLSRDQHYFYYGRAILDKNKLIIILFFFYSLWFFCRYNDKRQ